MTFKGCDAPNSSATVAVVDRVAVSATVPAKLPSSTAPTCRLRDGLSGCWEWTRWLHRTIRNGSPTASGSSQSRRSACAGRCMRWRIAGPKTAPSARKTAMYTDACDVGRDVARERHLQEAAGDHRGVAYPWDRTAQGDAPPATASEQRLGAG